MLETKLGITSKVNGHLLDKGTEWQQRATPTFLFHVNRLVQNFLVVQFTHPGQNKLARSHSLDKTVSF